MLAFGNARENLTFHFLNRFLRAELQYFFALITRPVFSSPSIPARFSNKNQVFTVPINKPGRIAKIVLIYKAQLLILYREVFPFPEASQPVVIEIKRGR